MKVDQQTVHKIAGLARLSLEPNEEATFAKQLDEVVAYFATLDGVDVADVPPTSSAVPIDCPTRTDKTDPFGGRDDLIGQAPAAEDGFFTVPRVIDA